MVQRRRGTISRHLLAAGLLIAAWQASGPAQSRTAEAAALQPVSVPRPQPATRPERPRASPASAQADRLQRLNAAKSWGYQLAGLRLEEAKASPYDLLVLDAANGVGAGGPLPAEMVAGLKQKPDGQRRLVVSYLSIGEAEDYRADYFGPEYMEEEAPDWLLHENPKWKGNRLINFCNEGWQQTILGDETGRSLYNSIEASPLYRLLELGLDGVYLDRVDAYADVAKQCPNAEARMVDFVVRLAAHARKRNPHFLVIMQNAEELVRHAKLRDAIDGIAKEDLFYGADHTQAQNSTAAINASLAYLKQAKAAGRAVFAVDYVKDTARIADARRRMLEQGFVPYVAPRALDQLWLP